MPPVIIDLHQAEDSRDVVHRAVQALAEGGLVAFPTETVYGVGACARHDEAVRHLAEAKGRDAASPFALAIKSAEEAVDYVPDMNPLACRLARRCWPGPVTLVVDATHEEGLAFHLPDAVRQAVCPNGTLGLRVAASPILQDVLRMLAGPVALTSANRSGEADPINAQQVVEALGEDLALVLDDGPCRYGQPSSVVRVHGREFKVLREGVVAEATLRRLANALVVLVCTGNTCRSPMAEALTRQELARRRGCQITELEDHGVTVASAGLAAVPGGPPSHEAVQVMQEHNLDLSQHESRPLTDQLVRQADLMLTMTSGHRQAVIERWPEAADRTLLVLPDNTDVADPIGRPLEVYRRCAQQLSQGIAHHADRVDEFCGLSTEKG